MEQEFLNRFYNRCHVVNMTELTNTIQQDDKLVIEYINRWHTLSLKCKDHLSKFYAT